VRFVSLVVGIAVVFLVAYLIYRGVTAVPASQTRRLPTGGRWQARHYADDGHTVVAVVRMTSSGEVVEEHVVARIADADEDWSRKFLAAQQEAEERAFHLNADPPP
jgi:pyridoxamine 5'-phosphate oxidase family protein